MDAEPWLVVGFPVAVVFLTGCVRWIARKGYRESDFHLGLDLCLVTFAAIVSTTLDARSRVKARILTHEHFDDLIIDLIAWAVFGLFLAVVILITHQRYDEESVSQRKKAPARPIWGTNTFWPLCVFCNLGGILYLAGFLLFVVRKIPVDVGAGLGNHP